MTPGPVQNRDLLGRGNLRLRAAFAESVEGSALATDLTEVMVAPDTYHVSPEPMLMIADLHGALLRYAHAFHIQTTRTNLVNGRSKIEERLARWLLMADDRIDGNVLPLTHEFLSIMLGVRRAGVTVAVQALEASGFITVKRGLITIIDRKGLIENSDGTYVPPDTD